MSSDPLVSVVVPVYNGSEYLSECLQSILQQTYDHWDCAIVDNASTDTTPVIAQEFAARDSRFRHLRFDRFVSATANHNRAFASINASSQFCKVVQGDDWLYPDCLRRMVDAASGHPTVGIVSAYQLWGRVLHLNGLPYETTLASGHEILRSTLRAEFNVTGGPTAHMLRSEFVLERQPFYADGLRHQDTEAALWMLSRHDFAFVHQVLTYARNQPGARSRWSTRMRSNRPEDIIFLLRYGPPVMEPSEYRRHLRRRLRGYVAWHLKQVVRLSWLNESEFFRFHDQKRRQILEEAHGDPEVIAAMAAVHALLLRRPIAADAGGAKQTE